MDERKFNKILFYFYLLRLYKFQNLWILIIILWYIIAGAFLYFLNFIIILLTLRKLKVCKAKYYSFIYNSIYIHCNKFFRIYITNHMNYTVRVANCCKHWFYLIFYIELFSINSLKSQDFSSPTQFMLTHTRYLMYILIHYKLKKVNKYLI